VRVFQRIPGADLQSLSGDVGTLDVVHYPRNLHVHHMADAWAILRSLKYLRGDSKTLDKAVNEKPR